MAYKLHPIVERISSPIILRFDGGREEQRYANGNELAAACFDKRYLIVSIAAREECVIVTVRENELMNGEVTDSFF